MGCVCWRVGDLQALLTLYFRLGKLQLSILLPKKNSAIVDAALDEFETYLASSFPDIILDDRGCEFADAGALETSCLLTGKRCSFFYCDPLRSDQKAQCENNHRFIRRIAPKGTDFDDRTEESVARVNSHINSVPRKSLDGTSPLLLAKQYLPEEFFDALSIQPVPSDEMLLTPRLLKTH